MSGLLCDTQSYIKLRWGTMVICDARTRNTDPMLQRQRLVIDGEVTVTLTMMVDNLTAARDMLQTGAVLGPSRLMEKNSF